MPVPPLRPDLRDLVARMRRYGEHESLYRDAAVGRQVREWADELDAALSAAPQETEPREPDVVPLDADVPESLVPIPTRTWQPIETAPKDEVLMYRPQMPQRARIVIRRLGDWCGPECCPDAEPTLWMPLPSAPDTKE